MMIHDITSKVGSHRKPKRVGRGIGSGLGKTCGRGHKGAGSRSGWSGSIRSSREGGQMPFFRRIAKRGFSNARFKKVFAIVNLKDIESKYNEGDRVTPERLVEDGLVSSAKIPVKILGEGTLTKKLDLRVSACSKTAIEKIKGAGGTIDLVQPNPDLENG